VAFLLFACAPASAQWLKYPTPGMPRTPDGKPDLSAPVPRAADGKPDVSGLWQPRAGGYQMNATADLRGEEMLPWAVALARQRADNLARESPVAHCLPEGPVIAD